MSHYDVDLAARTGGPLLPISSQWATSIFDMWLAPETSDSLASR